MEEAERQHLRQQLARLADGDREAFRPVFLALQPIVRRFAARHVPAEAAEDVAQEALMKVFAQAPRFDPEKDAVAWAVEIASWELRTWQRRRQRRREDALDETALRTRADTAPTPEDLAMAESMACSSRRPASPAECWAASCSDGSRSAPAWAGAALPLPGSPRGSAEPSAAF